MLVYKITNKINGKVYIGQTIKTLEEREKGYLKEVRSAVGGLRPSRPMVSALIKYGFDNFSFEVLEDNILDMETLNQLEIDLIKEYDSHVSSGKGYNVEFGGQNSIMSQETRDKISLGMEGDKHWVYKLSKEELPWNIQVIELTTGKTFASSVLADEHFGITNSRKSCTGDSGSVGGYVFRKIEDGEIAPPNKIVGITQSIYDNILPEYKQYVKLVNHGKKSAEFAKSNGYSQYHADKSIEIIDITSGTTYPSVREAARVLKSSSGNITRNIAGNIGSVNGRVFRKIIDGEIYYKPSFAKPLRRVQDAVLSIYKEVV